MRRYLLGIKHPREGIIGPYLSDGRVKMRAVEPCIVCYNIYYARNTQAGHNAPTAGSVGSRRGLLGHSRTLILCIMPVTAWLDLRSNVRAGTLF